jgi:hypothetical protein
MPAGMTALHYWILGVAGVAAFFGGAGFMFGILGFRKLKEIKFEFNGNRKHSHYRVGEASADIKKYEDTSDDDYKGGRP